MLLSSCLDDHTYVDQYNCLLPIKHKICFAPIDAWQSLYRPFAYRVLTPARTINALAIFLSRHLQSARQNAILDLAHQLIGLLG